MNHISYIGGCKEDVKLRTYHKCELVYLESTKTRPRSNALLVFDGRLISTTYCVFRVHLFFTHKYTLDPPPFPLSDQGRVEVRMGLLVCSCLCMCVNVLIYH